MLDISFRLLDVFHLLTNVSLDFLDTLDRLHLGLRNVNAGIMRNLSSITLVWHVRYILGLIGIYRVDYFYENRGNVLLSTRNLKAARWLTYKQLAAAVVAQSVKPPE